MAQAQYVSEAERKNFYYIKLVEVLDKNSNDNIHEKYEKLRKRKVLVYIWIPTWIALLICSIILIITGSNSWSNGDISFDLLGFFTALPVITMIFGFIVLGSILFFSGLLQIDYFKELSKVIDEICKEDYIGVFKLSLAEKIATEKVPIIVKKLVDSGNLEGYEIVDSTLIAKTSLGSKLKGIIEKTKKERMVDKAVPANININIVADKPERCPSCGSARVSDSKFCSYCGTKLRD